MSPSGRHLYMGRQQFKSHTAENHIANKKQNHALNIAVAFYDV